MRVCFLMSTRTGCCENRPQRRAKRPPLPMPVRAPVRASCAVLRGVARLPTLGLPCRCPPHPGDEPGQLHSGEFGGASATQHRHFHETARRAVDRSKRAGWNAVTPWLEAAVRDRSNRHFRSGLRPRRRSHADAPRARMGQRRSRPLGLTSWCALPMPRRRRRTAPTGSRKRNARNVPAVPRLHRGRPRVRLMGSRHEVVASRTSSRRDD